jgi:hypothetical protein
MDSGLVGQLVRDRTKGEEGLRPFEEAGWWYRQRDVYTATTRMEHMGNGE